MASAFETAFAADQFPELLAEFGESVTYTALGGTAASVSAIVIRTEMQALGPDGVRIEQQHELWVSRSSVSNARKGDSVALLKKTSASSATTMKVTRIIEEAGGAWHLALQ